jgi:serine/threonine protein kinase/tetratricopeptide (TPR) repeat protein
MSTTDDRLNAALGDRYRIEREIGAGGMATVHLALDLRHNRKVAIKVLRRELAAALGGERFLREIETTAGLRHPNILPLFDSGQAGGILYYVMPYVEGESLRDRLDREGRIPLDDAVRIAREVADALSYAHSRGIVHRDIKPENIMLEGGHAVVADFGIAHAVDSAAGARMTGTGLAVGTPAYMSPEQAAGEQQLDGRSDLYSLGCVVFEMIAGRPPFIGPSPQSIIAKRFTEAAPELEIPSVVVPGSVRSAVRKLLQREAPARYATGAELVHALAHPSEQPPEAPPAPSIAVLPFANMSGADDEFFADGVTEEIINTLVQHGGLRVAARTSCFAFKGRNEDLRRVGEQLGVGTVLEGSIRKSGTRMRITAQLINVADGYHIWSERYDRELTDVFAVQDELAQSIATRLRGSLTTPERLLRAAPRSAEAYEQLLRGRVLLWKRGRAILDALDCFERAVALDPDLVDAHALLGDSCRLLAVYGIAPPVDMFARARAAAERALALDPEQVEALATLASIAAFVDWDAEASWTFTTRALAVDPGHIRALCERSAVFAVRGNYPGRTGIVLADLARASEVDPLNAWVAAVHAMALASQGQNEHALREAERAVEIDRDAFTGHWVLVWAYSAAGRDEAALAQAERALLMSGRNPRVLTEVAAIHGRNGRQQAAEGIFLELASRAKTGHIGFAEQGCAAASAGMMDAALELVAKAKEVRDPYLLFLASPAWRPFHADPRGREMLAGAGP